MSSRSIRYSGLYLASSNTATIVGVGAIGSQIAILLARSGLITHLTIIDPDTVSLENLGPQAFDFAEIGKPKVEALAARLKLMNPDLSIQAIAKPFDPSHLTLDGYCPTFLFACVDSMEIRRQIGEAFIANTPSIRAIFDARMGAETAQILTFTDEEYLKTIFPDSEAIPLPCSERATPHCPVLSAAFLFYSFTHFIRAKRNAPTIPPKALCIDLPSLMLAEVPLESYAPDAPISITASLTEPAVTA